MKASDRKELRVILDNINVLNDEWFDTFPTDEGQTSIHDSLEYEIMKADKILAKRPRNCDVGTASQQAQRFAELCTSHSKDGARGICDEKCPFYGKEYGSDCALVWAQMPYERGIEE